MVYRLIKIIVLLLICCSISLKTFAVFQTPFREFLKNIKENASREREYRKLYQWLKNSSISYKLTNTSENEMADFLEKIHEFDKAQQLYQSIFDQDPANSHALSGKFRCLFHLSWPSQEKESEILNAFKEYYHINPSLVCIQAGLELATSLDNIVLGDYFFLEWQKKYSQEIINEVGDYLWMKLLRNDTKTLPFDAIDFFLAHFPDHSRIGDVWIWNLERICRIPEKQQQLAGVATYWHNQNPKSYWPFFHMARTDIMADPITANIPQLIDTAKQILNKPPASDLPVGINSTDWVKWKNKELAYLSYFLARYQHLTGNLDDSKQIFQKIYQSKIINMDPMFLFHYALLLEVLHEKDLAVHFFITAWAITSSAQNLWTKALTLSGIESTENFWKYLKTSFSEFTEFNRFFPELLHEQCERVAWNDYNNDTFPDLLIDGRKILINQSGKGFNDETSLIFDVAPTLNYSGGLMVDWNNDHCVDVLQYSKEGNMNLLVQKNEKLYFAYSLSDNTFPYPIEAAVAGDWNQDGKLDFYISRYEIQRHLSIGSFPLLLLNDTNDEFKDITTRIKGLPDEPMCGRGITTNDFDDDGDLDIYCANYRLDPNYLLENRGQGNFQNIAYQKSVAGTADLGLYGHSIGVEMGDIDNDGDMDLICANLAHPRDIGYSDTSKIFVNTGFPNYQFIEEATWQIPFFETHTSPSLADFDCDGDLDLFMTLCDGEWLCQMYINSKNGFEFYPISNVRIHKAWDSAIADFDCDGDYDLAVGGSELYIMQNQKNPPIWIGIILNTPYCNWQGIGSKITYDGSISQVRTVTAGKGAGSQHSTQILVYPLNTKDPATVTVRWPCGGIQKYKNLAINQYNKLIESKDIHQAKR